VSKLKYVNLFKILPTPTLCYHLITQKKLISKALWLKIEKNDNNITLVKIFISSYLWQ